LLRTFHSPYHVAQGAAAVTGDRADAETDRRVAMGAWMAAGGVLLLGLTALLLASCESSMSAGRPRRATAAKPEVSLDFEYFPRGEERALRLLVSRPEIGLAFKLHCFESAPFRNGTAEKRPGPSGSLGPRSQVQALPRGLTSAAGASRQEGDGVPSVVFTYTSGEMKCVTTFTPMVGGRVAMDLEVTGPLEELKKIKFIDGCMQHWESPAFRRRGPLTEFAERAFICTMRGPVSLLDTPRGNQKAFGADSPWNNPPGTQWYVHPSAQHPGDIWGFGTCGDRPVIGLIGAVSRDGKWLTAIGRPYNLNIGQGWHDCLHCGAHTRWYLDEAAATIRQRTMLYVMPNDKEALLRARLADFPDDDGVTTEPSDNQGLADPRPGSRLGKPLSVEESGQVLRVRPAAAGAPGARGGVGESLPHVVGVTGRPAAARGAEPLWGGRQADAGDWLRCPSPAEELSPSDRRSFAYTVPAGFETVEFAHCYPYQPEDLEKTLAEVASVWQGEVLGYSHHGRPLWRYVSNFEQPGSPRPGFYLLARQHAGETPGSWVLDGLLRHLAADDSTRAAAVWWVAPFVNIDDVVEGSYGKDPFPCDCNRAWHTIPLRTETKLLQADIARWTKCCRPCFLIDLHAPGHRERETYVHLPREGRSGQEYALVFDFARRFREALPCELRGEKWWERPTYPSRFTVGSTVTSWFYDTYALPGAAVETSYQGTAGHDYTITDYGRVGQALAASLVQLARESPL
jgi:hypothetical protein